MPTQDYTKTDDEFELLPDESEDYDITAIDDEVEVDDEEGSDEAFYYDEDEVNLVEAFQSHPEGAEALKKLVAECDEEVRCSWDKNEDYRKKQARDWETIFCDVPPKDAPFENCANVAMPIALENITKLSHRIYNEIFGDWSGVFTFTPASPSAVGIAPMVEEHSNWQIRNAMPSFKREQYKGVFMFIAGGDVVCHSYYDPTTRKNCHKILTCDDFVTPYTHTSMSPDFSDVPWVARRIPFHKHKLRSMKGSWENVDKVIANEPPDEDGSVLETELRTAVRERMGEEPGQKNSGEYEIIHYEGWLMLPNQDNERYCQLIFDIGTKTALKLSIHESASYEERARYKMQLSQKEQYIQQLEMVKNAAIQKEEIVESLRVQLGNMGQEASEVGNVAMMLNEAKNMPLPPDPVQPNWMNSERTEPEPAKKEPIYMFSHGVCIEPILGNMGIGLGTIHTQLNSGANVVMNQFIDAATLGNGKTLITAGNFHMDKLKIGPGVVNKAKGVMPGELKSAIHELSFGAANPQLLQAFEMMSQGAENAGHTHALMSGGAGKSGETARGLQGRTEQMNIMASVPAMKYADFVIQIMKNNNKLNARFLNETEVFFVNRWNNEVGEMRPEQVEIMREMYDSPYELELQSDIQFKGRAQKISEADEVVQMPNAVPILQQNWAFQYNAVKNALEARGLKKEARGLLGAPPAPTQQAGPPAPPPGEGPPQGQQ
jgi:hypothetical protein